jgi:hypothetical protein
MENRGFDGKELETTGKDDKIYAKMVTKILQKSNLILQFVSSSVILVIN